MSLLWWKRKNDRSNDVVEESRELRIQLRDGLNKLDRFVQSRNGGSQGNEGRT